ncbi:MAG: SidJ-related pseudokinase [Syntrophobacteria bacterium]
MEKTGMKELDVRRQRAVSEHEIKDAAADFLTKYYAVYHLQCLARRHPQCIDSETIVTLETLLKDPEFSQQRRGLFLFRQAAEALAAIIVNSKRGPMPPEAFVALKRVLSTTGGHAHRMAAEALGGLPFSIYGPELKETAIGDVPEVNLGQVADEAGLITGHAIRCIGRSLVVPGEPGDKLLVFKFGRPKEAPEALCREVLWMEHLRTERYAFPLRFDIPRPVRMEGAPVFSLKEVAEYVTGVHPEGYAVAYVADKDYFTYANEPADRSPVAETEFKEVMFRNAWVLAKLASLGIVHCAPIPLFHNRLQRCRRNDQGRYRWFRAGRLDRWLHSCKYPNFGRTGMRDFEHFISFQGRSRDLYRHIGTHFLGLLLVAGSCFRNKDRERIGFVRAGNAADARDLFNRELLAEIIQGVFLNYYQGFVGEEFRGDPPIHVDELTGRMIEEMGVDRHMEEVLRVADQRVMTDEQFRAFLEDRGSAGKERGQPEKGVRDIVLQTGPHLGGFNEGVSLPELIESVATMSALCILGRYWRQDSRRVLGKNL